MCKLFLKKIDNTLVEKEKKTAMNGKNIFMADKEVLLSVCMQGLSEAQRGP